MKQRRIFNGILRVQKRGRENERRKESEEGGNVAAEGKPAAFGVTFVFRQRWTATISGRTNLILAPLSTVYANPWSAVFSRALRDSAWERSQLAKLLLFGR